MSRHDQTCSPITLQDQRAEARTSTVFRPVVIEADEFAGLCLVRNLSPHGMRGKAYTSTFRSGGPITVHFGSGDVVQGSLVWIEEDHIGVKFKHAIDVAQLLANLSKKVLDGKFNRALRLSIHSMGELVIGARDLKMEVVDISQRGIKVLTSYVRPGDEVYVRLVGLGQRKAIVRWTEAGMAGLNFLCPLSFDELAHWVGQCHKATALDGISRVSGSQSNPLIRHAAIGRVSQRHAAIDLWETQRIISA